MSDEGRRSEARFELRPGAAGTGPAELATSAGSSLRGRGAASNPPNRFEVLHYEVEPDDRPEPWPGEEPEPPRPRTLYLADPTRKVLAHNESPDVPFDVSLNPYRGCEHGCSYCYARPTHEFLNLSAGLDFETRILVKQRAPELLHDELASPRWRPRLVGMSGVTDAYQPIERRLELTRRCLRVFADFRNPVGIVTKNALVARDTDLLAELAEGRAVSVTLSITTLDGELQRRMEPRASHPGKRLEAIEALSRAGVPVGVNVAPVVPGLTDHEIPAILNAAARAGASFAGFIALRLPHGVKALFEDWLERHYPERRRKVLSRIRAMRGGALDDSRFGSRMRGEGQLAEQNRQLFELARRRAGLDGPAPELSAAGFRRAKHGQLSLL